MKTALIQRHAALDRADNLSCGTEAIEESASNGANLAAYAELAFEYFLPQHPAAMESIAASEPIPGPTTDPLRNKAKQLGVTVVLNLFEVYGGRSYDTSPVIDADESIVVKTRMVQVIEAPCFHERGCDTQREILEPGSLKRPQYGSVSMSAVTAISPST